MSFICRRVAPIGAERDRVMLKDAEALQYGSSTEIERTAHLFRPSSASDAPSPVVICFHSGLWETSTPAQFVPQCLHFASRGALAIAAETRVSSSHTESGALEAIEDARKLIRWVREHADELHLDPERITLVGAGGGALLALLAAMPKPKKRSAEEEVACQPQALVLLSALVNTAVKGPVQERFPDSRSAKINSPSQLVRRKLPPMLFLHGVADRVAPFSEVEKFHRRLRWRGNKVELREYLNADHSFFNFNVSPHHFEATLAEMDEFLTRHGMLDPTPPHVS